MLKTFATNCTLKELISFIKQNFRLEAQTGSEFENFGLGELVWPSNFDVRDRQKLYASLFGECPIVKFRKNGFDFFKAGLLKASMVRVT